MLSLSIMFYICCCAVLTLFRVKVFNVYSLHADRQTGDVSMSWFTSYVCKLTFPLAYNFMTMTMVKGSTAGPDKVDPVFSRVMRSLYIQQPSYNTINHPTVAHGLHESGTSNRRQVSSIRPHTCRCDLCNECFQCSGET